MASAAPATSPTTTPASHRIPTTDSHPSPNHQTATLEQLEHSNDKQPHDLPAIDLEKNSHSDEETGLSGSGAGAHTGSGDKSTRWTNHRLVRRLLTWGNVELRGISPVPLEERVNHPYSKIFFVWFSMNFNILSFSAGTLGPAVFDLGLRDTCLTILFFNLLCCAFPAYFVTWGPKLGMRQMVISRYSFGYYGVILPCIMNLIGMIGFSILNCILGGQALAAAASSEGLSWTVGIVIIALISLLVSFCGYNVLNWYERIAWFPVFITFIIALGVGGKHLSLSATPSSPTSSDPPPPTGASASASAPQILSFASTLAGFAITYSGLSADFSSYYRPYGHPHPHPRPHLGKTKSRDMYSWALFGAAYAGFLVPIVTLQCLGAATALAAPFIPSWSLGYGTGGSGNVGGLLEAMLQPLGGFGKFLTVLLSLSVAGNIAASFYSVTLNFQVLAPGLFGRVPRAVWAVVATAIVVPISIVGAHRFYDTLVNFLGLIGYWASAYVAIVLVEHHVFRARRFQRLFRPRSRSGARKDSSTPDPPSAPDDNNDDNHINDGVRIKDNANENVNANVNHPYPYPYIPTSYPYIYAPTAWDQPRSLPSGIPALAAGVLSFGLVIPSMDQVWFVGPIARKTGDVGFEAAFVVAGTVYVVLRAVEVRWRGGI